MKKHYILPISAIIFAGFLSFQKSGNFKIEKFFSKNGHLNASGSPIGRTGAPGEQNCTGCHSGSAQSGATENTLVLINNFTPVTTYLPGSTYSATLTMASNPAKKGFQATALDGTNTMAGTFVASTNTAISGTTRKYANHKSTSNTSAVTSWLWSWTAPATNVGDITFYVATNKTNSNNNDSGDIIYLSQHVIGVSASSGISEVEKQGNNFIAGYAPDNNSVIFNFNNLSAGDLFFNLVDMNGRSVFTYDLGAAQIGENKQSIILPSDLKNGMYVVNLFLNNRAMSAKISVQK